MRLCMRPAVPPAATQTSCCCPHPHAGTGTHNDGQPQDGPTTIRRRAGLQAPRQIQHSHSAARAKLHNTSHSHIPMALLEESDYPAECYLTCPKDNLYIFFWSDKLKFQYTCLQEHCIAKTCNKYQLFIDYVIYSQCILLPFIGRVFYQQ